jgi:hypothetical protein
MEPLYNMAIPRLDKAIEFIGNVTQVEPTHFLVKSNSDPNKYYDIDLNEMKCQCGDNYYREVDCWHIRAIRLFQQKSK